MAEAGISSLSTKGQITIPKEVREAAGLNEGDRVVFIIEGDKIYMKKVTKSKLSNILERQRPLGVSALDLQRRLREEWQP